MNKCTNILVLDLPNLLSGPRYSVFMNAGWLGEIIMNERCHNATHHCIYLSLDFQPTFASTVPSFVPNLCMTNASYAHKKFSEILSYIHSYRTRPHFEPTTVLAIYYFRRGRQVVHLDSALFPFIISLALLQTECSKRTLQSLQLLLEFYDDDGWPTLSKPMQ